MSLNETTPVDEAGSVAAPVAAPNPPAKAPLKKKKGLRRDKLRPEDFKPRKSSAFQERTITLNSLPAQQLFERTYARTQIALYNIRVMAQMLGDRQTAKELSATVQSMVTNVVEELDTAVQQLSLTRTQKGRRDLVSFSDPESHTVIWHTPTTNTFLDILELYDSLVAEIETLWMYGHFDDDQKNEIVFEWRTRLTRFARSILDLQTRSYEAVNRRLGKTAKKPLRSPPGSASKTDAVAPVATGSPPVDAPVESPVDAPVESPVESPVAVAPALAVGDAFLDAERLAALGLTEAADKGAAVVSISPDVPRAPRKKVAAPPEASPLAAAG